MIKYLVIDVDGTMTDGGIYYDENGNEIKKFSTKDAAGIFAARNLGIQIIVLTGRKCIATERRMKELQVDILEQNIKNKYQYLKEFMSKKNLSKMDIGYIGDDLNDYSSMALAGFTGCPADACAEIKKHATYISPQKGGDGAVRDIIEYLVGPDCWKAATRTVYGIGV